MQRSADGDPPAAGYPVTGWTTVGEARQYDTEKAVEALGRLYERYRKPLIGLLQSRGKSAHESEETFQSFFVEKLISKKGLLQVSREKGKFRTFIRTSLIRYAIDQWRGTAVEKTESIDEDPDDAHRTRKELRSPGPQPDEKFDEAWAVAVLRNAMDRLEADYKKRRRTEVFEVLHVFLAAKKPGLSHREAAKELVRRGEKELATDNAVKTEVHRMRQRYGEMIDFEIATTLAHPTLDAIKEEKEALLKALGAM